MFWKRGYVSWGRVFLVGNCTIASDSDSDGV